ncbi:RagB/SusD family nutrient uptake outer membrane protein [Maribellus sp. CM-23]|uniref:RagB/SusD family nutrient uptake outer membrane protein n=1 Tax=Maribellus sp. CM-23 TaxID=2781026 RepID=UPI001F34C7AF|nr:RagB/SusD family nutrient uptake outer membrane protein [Maribellus sp. CM-23]
MKNIVFLFLAGLLVFSACQDDILDKEPLNIIGDNIVWSDIKAIEAHLAGSYSMMSIFENETPDKYVGIRSGVGWTIEAQVGASLINNISDEGTWGFYNSWSNYRFGGITVNGGLLEWWENAYVIIRQLNDFIENVPNSPLSDEQKSRLVAEARFLRAYNYFSMVRRYGGVPLIIKAQTLSDTEESLHPKRNSEKESYDFVISEIDDVYNDLPEVAESGRASMYAALTLKSRAALYAGSIAEYGNVQLDGLLGIPASEAQSYYQKSYDASKMIIDDGIHNLYDVDPDKVKNFRDVFMIKGNPEAIFVAAHDTKDMIFAGGNGWYWDFMQAPMPHGWSNGNQNQPYLSFIASTFEKSDGTAPDLSKETLEGKLWDDNEIWQEMEPRFLGTIYTHGTPWQGGKIDWHQALIVDGAELNDPNGAYLGITHKGMQALKNGPYTSFGLLKYLDEGRNNLAYGFDSKQDWQIFRFAEVLLNYAEAAFKLNKPGEALSAINAIRNRAGVAPRGDISFELIKKERKVELAFEGHRYWDLRRWRIAETEIIKRQTGLRYVRDYASGKLQLQVIENIDGGPNVTPVFESHYYYLPITKTRTQQNSNLIENPGYE